jgi:hypothetical protein
MALRFRLSTKLCVKLPIEAYRCIRSSLERKAIAEDLDNYPASARRAADAHRRYSQQYIFEFRWVTQLDRWSTRSASQPAWPAMLFAGLNSSQHKAQRRLSCEGATALHTIELHGGSQHEAKRALS